MSSAASAKGFMFLLLAEARSDRRLAPGSGSQRSLWNQRSGSGIAVGPAIGCARHTDPGLRRSRTGILPWVVPACTTCARRAGPAHGSCVIRLLSLPTCRVGPVSPWTPAFAPPAPPPIAGFCWQASQLLRLSLTARTGASSATVGNGSSPSRCGSVKVLLERRQLAGKPNERKRWRPAVNVRDMSDETYLTLD